MHQTALFYIYKLHILFILIPPYKTLCYHITRAISIITSYFIHPLLTGMTHNTVHYSFIKTPYYFLTKSNIARVALLKDPKTCRRLNQYGLKFEVNLLSCLDNNGENLVVEDLNKLLRKIFIFTPLRALPCKLMSSRYQLRDILTPFTSTQP